MNFDYLCIYTNNSVLKENYITHIENHNKLTMTKYPNAGFDILIPDDNYDLNNTSILLDTEIICSMTTINDTNLSYYLYPRSSIIKTPLRLANSVGIIDSGYRGNIKVCFDIIKKKELNLYDIDVKNNIIKEPDFKIVKYSRLVQICSPTLKPLIVRMTNNLEDLGLTDRGIGGFGSTGI